MQKQPKRRDGPLYIHGVPRRKKETVQKGLQKVYGVGPTRARLACQRTGILGKTLRGQRERDHVVRRERWMGNHLMMRSDRRRSETNRIQKRINRGTYRGVRMRLGLPVRGQRTSTNATTARRLNPGRGKVKR